MYECTSHFSLLYLKKIGSIIDDSKPVAGELKKFGWF